MLDIKKNILKLLGVVPAVLLNVNSAMAATDDEIVLCTIDDTSGFLAAMSTPKTWGYQLAVEEIIEEKVLFKGNNSEK